MNDEEHKTLAKLEYSIDEDGEIYIDILIEDYSDETLIQFARLLSSIPTSKFQLQTLGIAQEAFSKDGRQGKNELKKQLPYEVKAKNQYQFKIRNQKNKELQS